MAVQVAKWRQMEQTSGYLVGEASASCSVDTVAGLIPGRVTPKISRAVIKQLCSQAAQLSGTAVGTGRLCARIGK